jgi:hypothetical protein
MKTIRVLGTRSLKGALASKKGKGMLFAQIGEAAVKAACLRGHPKPAMQGHLRSGHTEGMDCGRKLGCGKAGSCTALEIAPRFPLSHNLNNDITLSVGG